MQQEQPNQYLICVNATGKMENVYKMMILSKKEAKIIADFALQAEKPNNSLFYLTHKDDIVEVWIEQK